MTLPPLNILKGLPFLLDRDGEKMGTTSGAKQAFIEKTSQSLLKRLLESLSDFWSDYKRRKIGLIGLFFLLVVVGLALIGPLFANTDIKMTTRSHARYSAPNWVRVFDPNSFKDQKKIDGLEEDKVMYSSNIVKTAPGSPEPRLKGKVQWAPGEEKHTFIFKDYLKNDTKTGITLTVNKTFTWDQAKPPKALLYNYQIDMNFSSTKFRDHHMTWGNATEERRVIAYGASYIKLADKSVNETFEHVSETTQLGSRQKGAYGIVLHSRIESPISGPTPAYDRGRALQPEVRRALFDTEGTKLTIIQAFTYKIKYPTEFYNESSSEIVPNLPATWSISVQDTKLIGESHYYGLMGTNEKGANLFALIVDGAQISLIIGFSVASATLLIGVAVGLISGYYGGLVDEAIQRAVDFLLVMPTLPLWMVLTSIFWEIGLSPVLVVWIVLTAFGWVGITKILRAQVLAEKQKPYIEAARASGVPNFRIMFKHILPNVLPLVMMYVMLSVQSAILGEAALSFLNLGPDWNSWGRILQHAAGPIMGGGAGGGAGTLLSAWWYMFFPGLFLALIGVGFMFIGLTVEAVFNPQRSY